MHFNPARPRAVLKIYIKLFTFSALVKSIINAEKTDKQKKKHHLRHGQAAICTEQQTLGSLDEQDSPTTSFHEMIASSLRT